MNNKKLHWFVVFYSSINKHNKIVCSKALEAVYLSETEDVFYFLVCNFNMEDSKKEKKKINLKESK